MNRARQLRLDRGLTISEVSEGTGIHRGSIRKIETGDMEFAPTLKALGDFYGVPASTLLLPAVVEQTA